MSQQTDGNDFEGRSDLDERGDAPTVSGGATPADRVQPTDGEERESRPQEDLDGREPEQERRAEEDEAPVDSVEQDDEEREAESEEDKAESEEDKAAAEEEARRRAEEFAREHDPADHDISAGEEFRQPGDWTAEDGDGPQELETTIPAHQSGDAVEAGMQSADGGDGAGDQDGGGQDSGEIRDGGHGWGSAAPLADGSVAPGHPVKAWHDTMTYVLPDEDGYQADPHECFVDAETAERAGFRHAHGD